MLTSSLFEKRKTFLNNVNPSVKLVSLLLFSVMIMLSKNIVLIAFLLTVSICLIVISGTSFNKLKPIMKMLIPLSIFIFIINILFNGDFIESISVVLKLYAVLIYSLIIPITTSMRSLNDGVSFLLKPFNALKINTNKVSLAITLSFNFLSYLPLQFKRIVMIQKSRGVNYENMDSKTKIVNLKELLFPIFVGAFRKADDLALAMEIRNFENNYQRKATFNLKDCCVIILHIGLLVLIIEKEVRL